MCTWSKKKKKKREREEKQMSQRAEKSPKQLEIVKVNRYIHKYLINIVSGLGMHHCSSPLRIIPRNKEEQTCYYICPALNCTVYINALSINRSSKNIKPLSPQKSSNVKPNYDNSLFSIYKYFKYLKKLKLAQLEI